MNFYHCSEVIGLGFEYDRFLPISRIEIKLLQFALQTRGLN
jgi:hypothetical protein